MSVSVSTEKLPPGTPGYDGGSMCLELALEGERLCKGGDCRAGVAFFQAAIRAGTDDLRTLSAIYSQLGNAYFYLGDFNKAVQFHKHDLTLARTINDKLGEAKASGNLGNTLKVIGKFDEAIQCCERHLEISRCLGDKLSEGRALYNLGNVYHAQGKHLGRVGQSDPGKFPREVRQCLLQAVSYYEQNLELNRSLGDRQAMGRACGNLGNTCYLLGDFTRAIYYHTERLTIAREVGDIAAERRANSNLGNSHIFLGQFENAAEHYKRTLALAEELGDDAVQAQACYSLGNTFTLLREYSVAEGYHARHLAAARKLQDRVGEGRACWSLGNAHAALGNHEKALYFAKEHYNISKELGDEFGMATAKLNIGDLSNVLGIPEETGSPTKPSSPSTILPEGSNAESTAFNALRVRRQSMEQMSLLPMTPKSKNLKESKDGENVVEEEGDEDDSENEEAVKDGANLEKKKGQKKDVKKPKELVKAESEGPSESFFELLSRCQSERMDEQRAMLVPRPTTGKLTRSASSGDKKESPNEEMLDVVKGKQPDRKGADPRHAVKKQNKAIKVFLPGLRRQQSTIALPDDDFLDMIARVQNTRLDDQRAELPRAAKPEERPKTLPDDDFFNLLMRAQSGRMEDQRATIPNKPANKGNTNPKN